MATAHRVLSGVIFAVVFSLGLFFRRTQPLVPWITCTATAIGIWEFFKFAEKKDFKAQGVWACFIGVLTVVEGYHFGLRHLPLLLTLALLGSLTLQLIRFGHDHFLAHVSISFLGCFYVSVPLAMGMAIFHAPGHPPNGRFLISFLILTVWASDVGAYFVGRAWGRHKLASRISPGKTIEGMVGGFATTLLTAAALKILWPDVSRAVLWPEAMILAVVFAVAGLAGDLAESALKRDAGVKDSSGFDFTGHGGMLDILDSLLFCIPIFYLHCGYLYPKLHPELFH